MAYVGTTAASSVSNPPIQIARGIAGGILGSSLQGAGLWFYSSSDGTTAMETSTYFTDGLYLGMRQGDVVLGAAGGSIGSTTQLSYVGLIISASTAGCGLSTGGTMTSTFG